MKGSQPSMNNTRLSVPNSGLNNTSIASTARPSRPRRHVPGDSTPSTNTGIDPSTAGSRSLNNSFPICVNRRQTAAFNTGAIAEPQEIQEKPKPPVVIKTLPLTPTPGVVKMGVTGTPYAPEVVSFVDVPTRKRRLKKVQSSRIENWPQWNMYERANSYIHDPRIVSASPALKAQAAGDKVQRQLRQHYIDLLSMQKQASDAMRALQREQTFLSKIVEQARAFRELFLERRLDEYNENMWRLSSLPVMIATSPTHTHEQRVDQERSNLDPHCFAFGTTPGPRFVSPGSSGGAGSPRSSNKLDVSSAQKSHEKMTGLSQLTSPLASPTVGSVLGLEPKGGNVKTVAKFGSGEGSSRCLFSGNYSSANMEQCGDRMRQEAESLRERIVAADILLEDSEGEASNLAALQEMIDEKVYADAYYLGVLARTEPPLNAALRMSKCAGTAGRSVFTDPNVLAAERPSPSRVEDAPFPFAQGRQVIEQALDVAALCGRHSTQLRRALAPTSDRAESVSAFRSAFAFGRKVAAQSCRNARGLVPALQAELNRVLRQLHVAEDEETRVKRRIAIIREMAAVKSHEVADETLPAGALDSKEEVDHFLRYGERSRPENAVLSWSDKSGTPMSPHAKEGFLLALCRCYDRAEKRRERTSEPTTVVRGSKLADAAAEEVQALEKYLKGISHADELRAKAAELQQTLEQLHVQENELSALASAFTHTADDQGWTTRSPPRVTSSVDRAPRDAANETMV